MDDRVNREEYNDFDFYQGVANTTAIYPPEHAVTYPLLGLAGEVGEFANKWKKTIRDGRPVDIDDARKELGDILWYVNATASDLNLSLGDIAHENIVKLLSRQERGVLGGSGDNR
jgi:NTP pyrophosphatase (non-canonical NTP hydrolase)